MASRFRLRIEFGVTVSGLVRRPELNGCVGVVVRLVDPSTGRFSVEVTLPSGKKEVVAIRAVNILLTKDEKRGQVAEDIANISLYATFQKIFETGSDVSEAEGIVSTSNILAKLQQMIYFVVMKVVPQLQGLLDAAFRDPSAIQGVFQFIQTLLERYNRMDLSDQRLYRERFCRHIAWSLPTLEILQIMKSIAGDATIGDFFTGNGLLATMASAFGVKMIASDLKQSPLPFCNILVSDAINAIRLHLDLSHYVMSWPPQDDTIGEKFLKAILSSRKAEDPPVTIFYFGTLRDGCCGTPGLFALFDEHFVVIASVVRSETETWSEIMVGPDDKPILDSFVVYQQKK
jgi:hypothetical protein